MVAYIQLADKLVEISGKVTEETIIQALGYKPATGEFDDIKNNPFVNDNTGEYKIIDEYGNIIAKFDKDGLHTTNIQITETLETPNILAEQINSPVIIASQKVKSPILEVTDEITTFNLNVTSDINTSILRSDYISTKKVDAGEAVTASNVIATEDIQASVVKVADTMTSSKIVAKNEIETEHLTSTDTEDFKIIDKQSNIILLADNKGITSTEFIAKTSNNIHKLSEKSNLGHTHGLLRLKGDVSGAALLGSNGATIDITVVNDSHLHDSRYYTKSELTEKGIPVLASEEEYFEVIDKKFNVILKVDDAGLRTTAIKLPSGDIQTQIDARYTKDELSNDGVDYLKASVFTTENNAFSIMDKNNNTILNIGSSGLFTTEVTAIDGNGIVHKLTEKGNSPYSEYVRMGGTLTERQYYVMNKYMHTPFIINANEVTVIPEDLLNSSKNGLFNEDYLWNIVKLPGGEPLIVVEWDNYSRPVKMQGLLNNVKYVINRTDWTIAPEGYSAGGSGDTPDNPTTGSSIITYTATNKIEETTDNAMGHGIHINKFEYDIISHDFADGVGTIVFNGVLTKLENGAFQGCSNLTTIEIPDSVTSIGTYAFMNCTDLTSIVIPDSVTSIGGSAFEYCSGLKNIVVGDGVINIGSGAFQGCSSLTAVTLGSGVTSIDSNVFGDCTSLKQITCKAVVAPSVTNTTFTGAMPVFGINSNGTLYYPQGSDYSLWLSTDNYYLGYYNWTGSTF